MGEYALYDLRVPENYTHTELYQARSANLQAGRELLQACEQLLACEAVDLEGWRYLRQVDEFIETVESYRKFYEEQVNE